MALKTVIKSLLSKWGPLSIELQQAIVVDQAAFTTIGSDPQFIDNGDARELLPSPEEPPVGRDTMRAPKNGQPAPESSPERQPGDESPEPGQQGGDDAPDMDSDTEMAIGDEMQRTGRDSQWLNDKVKAAGAQRFSKLKQSAAAGILAELRAMPNKGELLPDQQRETVPMGGARQPRRV